MFCTIKFVYYKSFCVRDDIGSYIRTVYHMVSHTPKRGVGGSNPLMDASEQRRKPLFSRVFGFSYMKRHEKALSLLAAADNVLIPVQAAYLPAKGLEQLLGTINKVKRQINPKLRIEGILLTICSSPLNH